MSRIKIRDETITEADNKLTSGFELYYDDLHYVTPSDSSRSNKTFDIFEV